MPDLQAFRRAKVGLAIDGAPLEARDRIVVVPTRAAAAQLVRSIETTLDHPRRAVVLPDFVTTDELMFRLAERLDPRTTDLHDAEREALAMVACRAARDAGHSPPFRLRPGLVAEVLRFYDALGRYQKDVDTFERLALGLLEPGAADDRGAERLVRQTRFLSAAFRELESRQAAAGADEHVLRARLVQMAAPRPWRHVVVAVGDRSSDPDGLWPADWDVLARLPRLIPAGLTSGRNTRRSPDTSAWTRSSHRSRPASESRKESSTCVPTRSRPCTPPKKPTAGISREELPRVIARTGKERAPALTSHRVRVSNCAPFSSRMRSSSMSSGSLSMPGPWYARRARR